MSCSTVAVELTPLEQSRRHALEACPPSAPPWSPACHPGLQAFVICRGNGCGCSLGSFPKSCLHGFPGRFDVPCVPFDQAGPEHAFQCFSPLAASMLRGGEEKFGRQNELCICVPCWTRGKLEKAFREDGGPLVSQGLGEK